MIFSFTAAAGEHSSNNVCVCRGGAWSLKAFPSVGRGPTAAGCWVLSIVCVPVAGHSVRQPLSHTGQGQDFALRMQSNCVLGVEYPCFHVHSFHFPTDGYFIFYFLLLIK